MITPLEIENKRFSKQMMNGYNVGEVDDFLDDLTLDYEKIYRENAELKSKLEDASDDVGQYKNIEGTLQSTLIMAQKTADEVVQMAKQQAEQIIKEAELNSMKSTENINTQMMIKTQQLEDLKKQIDVYKAKMEALLISQLELLKDVNDD